MTQNRVKNFGVGIFFSAVFIYALIFNYSLIGLGIAVISIGIILLIACCYGKERPIIDKLDLYIIIAFIGILALHFEQLKSCFDPELFVFKTQNIKPFQIMSLIIFSILALILSKISKNREMLIAKAILKSAYSFFLALGISLFCWGYLNIDNLSALIFINVLYGTIIFCKLSQSNYYKVMNRPSRISLLMSLIVIALSALFSSFQFSSCSLYAFLSITVLPWYSVLVLTLILFAIAGMGLYFGDDQIDEDTVFLVGFAGLLWVVKAAVYFYFSFNWIAICLYYILFISFLNRFVKRNAVGYKTYIHTKLIQNELYWILIAAPSVVASIYLIYKGYLYFWIAVLIGIIVTLFVHRIASGWLRDAILWISLLFSIAFSACMFSFQIGFHISKIVIISALFAFTSVIMWMLNHHNTVGQNKYLAAKSVIVVMFTILVFIPTFKGGAHIETHLENDTINVGALLKGKTKIEIMAEADGANNSIAGINYIWSDSFLFSEGKIVKTNRNTLTLPIKKQHLIIWVEDSAGVVSRKDCWFTGIEYESSSIDNIPEINYNISEMVLEGE